MNWDKTVSRFWHVFPFYAPEKEGYNGYFGQRRVGTKLTRAV